MTSGEKMIWAVTFSMELRRLLKDPPAHILGGRRGQIWAAWEKQQAFSAVEAASHAVDFARETMDEFVRHEDHVVCTRLREMCGEVEP